MLKQNTKGITLVSLVVTIIVLIILAGISINLILGDNGIIKVAMKARIYSRKALAEEIIDLKLNDIQIEYEGKATLENVLTSFN